MSTALSEAFHFDNTDEDAAADSGPTRHLQPVADETLNIRHVPGATTALTHQSVPLTVPLRDPAEEFAPARVSQSSRAQTNILHLRDSHERTGASQHRQRQLETIKKMTQTIGAAFVEAELGLRPVWQLSSWMEMGLFQKLRTRVERTVSGNYLAAKCSDGERTVPPIAPIGVRAAQCENGDWETSMTIRVGGRARAIAMRMRLHRERWQVCAFEIG